MKAFFLIKAVNEPYMGGSDAAMEIEVYPTLQCVNKWYANRLSSDKDVLIHANFRKLAELDEKFAWKTTFGSGVYPLHKEWCEKFSTLKIKLQKELQTKRAAAEKTKKGKRNDHEANVDSVS